MLTHFYYLFRATLWLTAVYVRAAWFFQVKIWNALDLPQSTLLSSRENRRLRHYFYGSSFLAALMGSLLKRSRSQQEVLRFAQLSALAFCFDDLVDHYPKTGDSDQLFRDKPEMYGRTKDPRGLALHLLQKIQSSLSPIQVQAFQDYMLRVFNLEIANKHLEATPKTSSALSTLEKIAAEKGGASVLLFRSVLAPPISIEEENAFYLFGGLIQRCDDIFDVWHDREAGISTTATYLLETGAIQALINAFEAQVIATQNALRECPFPAIQIETTIKIMHYLVSITRVCLNHFERKTLDYGALPLQNRTIMVVDMQKWSNRWRVIQYLLRSF